MVRFLLDNNIRNGGGALTLPVDSNEAIQTINVRYLAIGETDRQQDLAANILIAPEHVGQAAQFVIVAYYQAEGESEGVWFNRHAEGWMPWNGDLNALNAYSQRHALHTWERASLVTAEKRLPLNGQLQVWLAYQVNGQTGWVIPEKPLG
jgi:hypothetical protein